MTITAKGQTHVGLVKPANEDSWLIKPLNDSTQLVLVADGVSGSKHGEVASQQTVDTFNTLIDSGKLTAINDEGMRGMLLTMAVQRAHIDISRQGQENADYRFMACTCIVAIVDETSVCANQVGDSRLYLLSKGQLTQMTQDQTVARQLLAAGRITEDALLTHPDRNALSQALGVEAVGQPLEPELVEFTWQKGDKLLLCSDGLSDLVKADEIKAIISRQEEQDVRTQMLIQAALDGGGKDNITVILLENN